MVAIHVRPDLLHSQAKTLEQISSEVRRIGEDMLRATSNQPSYDGQFGPRVSSIGHEANARSQRLSSQASSRYVDLNQRASRFETADLKFLSSNKSRIYTPSGPRFISIKPPSLKKGVVDYLNRLVYLGMITNPFGLQHLLLSQYFKLPLDQRLRLLQGGLEAIKKVDDIRDMSKIPYLIKYLGTSDYFPNAVTIRGGFKIKSLILEIAQNTTVINAATWVKRIGNSANKIDPFKLIGLGASFVGDFSKYYGQPEHIASAIAVDSMIGIVSVGTSMAGASIGGVIGGSICAAGGVVFPPLLAFVPIATVIGATAGKLVAGYVTDYVFNTPIKDVFAKVPFVGDDIERIVQEDIVEPVTGPKCTKITLKEILVEKLVNVLSVDNDAGNFDYPSQPIDLYANPAMLSLSGS